MTSRSRLLKAALSYFEAQQPVIAVGADKRPYRAGWNEYFSRQQTQDEIKGLFSNGAWGIARVLYPACDYVHLDFDGIHSEEAWRQTGINLPETARVRTPSGGMHLIFKTSNYLKSVAIKRAVRVVEAGCNCKKSCGVDFLVNGYAVIPPSPGYEEDIPLDRAVKIPKQVIELAILTREKKKDSKFTGPIPDGKRHKILLAVGGRYLNEPGITYEKFFKKLSRVNESRCVPPLEPDELEYQAKDMWSRYGPAKTDEDTDSDLSYATIDSVKESEVAWLWQSRIPMGRLTLLCGNPDVGKSFFSTYLASRITQGEPVSPGHKPTTSGYVLMLSAEDSYSDVVRPRLRIMGADLTKIIIPNAKDGIPHHRMNAFVEKVAKEAGPALVVIDPVVAFLGKTDMSKAAEVRNFLSPLMLNSEKYGFACVIASHLNKQASGIALYRNSGSIDFVAAAPSVLLIAEDPEDPSRRVLAQIRNKLGPRQPSLSFSINDAGFVWTGEVEMSADELVAPGESKKRERQKLEGAKEFLTKMLAAGAMESENLRNKAKAAGISNRTLWRAKDELKIKAGKLPGNFSSLWWWRLSHDNGFWWERRQEATAEDCHEG